MDINGISPVDESLIILGSSSDHLIVDITESQKMIRVGDQIAFSLTYSGILSASHSIDVVKIFTEQQPNKISAQGN